jgi:hypothetical protein
MIPVPSKTAGGFALNGRSVEPTDARRAPRWKGAAPASPRCCRSSARP